MNYDSPMSSGPQQTPADTLRNELEERHAAVNSEITHLEEQIKFLTPVRGSLEAALDYFTQTVPNGGELKKNRIGYVSEG